MWHFAGLFEKELPSLQSLIFTTMFPSNNWQPIQLYFQLISQSKYNSDKSLKAQVLSNSLFEDPKQRKEENYWPSEFKTKT